MEFLRTHKILVGLGLITLIILLALIVAGSLYLAKQKTPVPVQQTNTNTASSTPATAEDPDLVIAEDAVTIAAIKGSLVYAVSSSTNSEANGQILFDETIFVWDPATANEYGLVQFKKSPYLLQVQLVGTKLYYIQGSDLIVLDLETKERTPIMSSTANFLITGDRLWYVIMEPDLKPKTIGVIDLATMKRTDITSNIQAQLGAEVVFPGGIAVRSYNPTEHSLVLASRYGDAGCGSIQLFKFNLDTNQISKTDSAVFCACDQETGNGCPLDTQAESHFNELAGVQPVCQGTQIGHDDVGNLVFTNPQAKKVAGSASYVGCIE